MGIERRRHPLSHCDIRITLDVNLCHQAYTRPMSRWDPNSRGRLERAAYDLFLEHGYENVTVAQIAERANPYNAHILPAL